MGHLKGGGKKQGRGEDEMGKNGRGKDFDNVLTTLQTPHLYDRMTVDLNNLVVSLWKQELAYIKICITAVPHNSHLLVFQESSLDTPRSIRRCLLQ